MRTALFALLPLVFVGPGCASSPASALHSYTVGTATYAAASPSASTAGTLPLRALACLVPGSVMRIYLGDRCILTGPLPLRGRAASATARLVNDGTCVLPGTNGDALSFPAASAVFVSVGDSVETTVAGTTVDARYVTYRFTGLTQDGPGGACARLEVSPPAPPVDGTALVAPGREAWEAWVPGPQVP